MDKLRQSIEFIQSRLRQLTPTHKMLIGSAVIIAVMGLFIVVQYAGNTDMVPLGVGDAHRTEAINMLKNAGIKYRSDADALLVPVALRDEAVRLLTENNVVGPDSSAMLLSIIETQKWWQNRQQNRHALNAAMSKVLTDIMSDWSYLRRAVVVITGTEQRRSIGMPVAHSSAAVAVTPIRDLTQAQIKGIAGFVASAIAGLKPADVQVLDARNGQPLEVESEDVLTRNALLDQKIRAEKHYQQKIYNALRNIPAVIVEVNAQVNVAREIISEIKYLGEGDGTITVVNQEAEIKSEETSARSGGVAGVAPNTGVSVQATGARGPANKTSDTTTSFETGLGTRTRQIEDPGGKITKVNATIQIPHSYLVRIWQRDNPDATDPPDDQVLAPIIQEQTAIIEQQITLLIETQSSDPAGGGASSGQPGGASPGQVSVAVYPDFDSTFGPLSSADQQEAGAGSWFLPEPGSFIGASWQSMVTAALALMSLFMMFKLARGSTVKRELPSAEELVGIPRPLQNDRDQLVGEADEAESAMEALELDEDEIRIRKLSEQLESLVETSPKQTASLVGKWITSTEE